MITAMCCICGARIKVLSLIAFSNGFFAYCFNKSYISVLLQRKKAKICTKNIAVFTLTLELPVLLS